MMNANANAVTLNNFYRNATHLHKALMPSFTKMVVRKRFQQFLLSILNSPRELEADGLTCELKQEAIVILDECIDWMRNNNITIRTPGMVDTKKRYMQFLHQLTIVLEKYSAINTLPINKWDSIPEIIDRVTHTLEYQLSYSNPTIVVNILDVITTEKDIENIKRQIDKELIAHNCQDCATIEVKKGSLFSTRDF